MEPNQIETQQLMMDRDALYQQIEGLAGINPFLEQHIRELEILSVRLNVVEIRLAELRKIVNPNRVPQQPETQQLMTERDALYVQLENLAGVVPFGEQQLQELEKLSARLTAVEVRLNELQ